MSKPCAVLASLIFVTLPVLLAAAHASPAAAQSATDREVRELRQRVQQLESQLVDLQVVIGTLESLARAPNRSGGGGSYGGSSDSRVSALETQIRALAAEVQQLRGGNGGGGYIGSRRGSSYGFGQDRSNAAPAQRLPRFGSDNSFASEQTSRSQLPPVTSRGSQSGGFGSTTVTPNGDPIGSILSSNDRGRAAAGGGDTIAGNYGGSPKSEYEAAYGALLQQNYAKAEQGFARFVQAHPRHSLAGNAQYWLGEVYYVRGDFKSAASAFLKGYQTYDRSPKAPDSLLKLAMSLDRLGQKDAACSSFGELSQKFPQAPGHIRSRATSERRRLGC